MVREACQATVHRVPKSRTQLKWLSTHAHSKKKKKCLPDDGFIITHYKAEHWRIDTFELWCWRRFLRVLWTARRANQSILKELNPEYSSERLTLKLMLQNFGHLIGRANSDSDAGKDWRQEEKGLNGGWDGWMASPTQRTWVCANSKRWWRTGKPGVLQSQTQLRVNNNNRFHSEEFGAVFSNPNVNSLG